MKVYFNQIDMQRRTIFYPKTDMAWDSAYIAALRSTYTQDIVRLQPYVDIIIRHTFGHKIAIIKPLAWAGTFHVLYHVVYDDQQLVVRLNRVADQQQSSHMLVDQQIYGLLATHGLPSLQVYAADISRTVVPTDYQVLGYSDGQPLYAFQDSQTQYMAPELLQNVGQLVAGVHKITLTGYGPLSVGQFSNVTSQSSACAEHICHPELVSGSRYDPSTISGRASAGNTPALTGIHTTWADYILLRLDEHIAVCHNIGAINHQEADTIKKLFLQNHFLFHNAPSVLLHGDLGNHNMLSSDGHTIAALIDWEDAMAGDPLFDIAFWGTFGREHLRDDFLVGYTTITALPSDWELRYWLYYLRIALSKTVHRFKFGYTDAPSRPPASQRIQRALGHIERLSPILTEELF